MVGRWAHDISGPNKVRVVITERRVSVALKIKRKSRTSNGSGGNFTTFSSRDTIPEKVYLRRYSDG
jgi:hypothetical protein